jgi:hypothetical protein
LFARLVLVASSCCSTAAETAWARGQVATVTLCNRRSASAICRAGPEAIDR